VNSNASGRGEIDEVIIRNYTNEKDKPWFNMGNFVW
jgi:hypothetical protein